MRFWINFKTNLIFDKCVIFIIATPNKIDYLFLFALQTSNNNVLQFVSIFLI